MTINVWPLDNAPSYTGRLLREMAVSLGLPMNTNTRPLGALSGVRWGTPVSTVTATSTQWTVNEHAGAVDAEAAAEAGPYGYSVNAAVTGSMNAADPTYTRLDLISVQISDPAEGDGTTGPGGSIVYTVGTPASDPGAPAAPARSLVLAQISVPPATSGQPSIIWQAPWLAGGNVAFPTYTALSQWVPTDGQVAYAQDQQALYQYYASAPTPGWYHTGGNDIVSGLAPAGGYHPYPSVGVANLRISRGEMILDGALSNVSAGVSINAGQAYPLANLPAPYPAVERIWPAWTSAGVAELYVTTGGVVTFIAPITASNYSADHLVISLQGVRWPIPGMK